MSPSIYVSLNFTYNAGSGGVLDVADNLCSCFLQSANGSVTIIRPDPKIRKKSIRRFMRFFAEFLIYRKISPNDTSSVILYPNYFFIPFGSKNIKQVVIVHDLQSVVYPKYMTVPRRVWLDLQHRAIKAFADGVVFISEATRSDFIRHYGAPKKHTVIYNPVLVPDEPSERRVRGISAPYAIANFHFYPHKNVGRVLSVISSLKRSMPTLKLVMTGTMPQQGTPERELLESESVTHLGYLPKEEVYDLIRGADFFVSMSQFEGFNMSAAECAKLGKPLILSDIPVHRELFTGWAFFVDLNNVSVCEDEIASYLQNFDRARRWVYSATTDCSTVAKDYLSFLSRVGLDQTSSSPVGVRP